MFCVFFPQFSEFPGYVFTSITSASHLSVPFCHWSPHRSAHRRSLGFLAATHRIPPQTRPLSTSPKEYPGPRWLHRARPLPRSCSCLYQALPPTLWRSRSGPRCAAHRTRPLPRPPQTVPLGTCSQLSAQSCPCGGQRGWCPGPPSPFSPQQKPQDLLALSQLPVSPPQAASPHECPCGLGLRRPASKQLLLHQGDMVPRGTAWRRAKEVSPSPSGLIHVKLPLAVNTGTPKGGGWHLGGESEGREDTRKVEAAPAP